jgi:hypothetical protein
MKRNFFMMAFVSLFTVVALCSCSKDEEEKSVASGVAGSCTWTLTGESGNYTLSISGNGAMTDYGSEDNESSPWYQYRNNIKNVIIQNGVTNIGEWAFHECALTSVSIGNSVRSIGDCAFRDCKSLVTLTVPNPVRTIGEEVFESCSSLTGINISGSVTEIDWTSAFEHCSKLADISIDADNPNYVSEDGVVFNKNKTILFLCAPAKTGVYSMPNSVVSIDWAAFFECESLTGIVISNSVTTIDEWAFHGLGSLTSVTISNSVTTIGDEAFAYCSSLTSITNLSATPQNIYNNGYSNVFDNTNISACTLKVPANAVNDYKAAPVWSEFGTIVAISD